MPVAPFLHARVKGKNKTNGRLSIFPTFFPHVGGRMFTIWLVCGTFGPYGGSY